MDHPVVQLEFFVLPSDYYQFGHKNVLLLESLLLKIPVHNPVYGH